MVAPLFWGLNFISEHLFPLDVEAFINFLSQNTCCLLVLRLLLNCLSCLEIFLKWIFQSSHFTVLNFVEYDEIYFAGDFTLLASSWSCS